MPPCGRLAQALAQAQPLQKDSKCSMSSQFGMMAPPLKTQALRTAPLPEDGEAPRPPLHAALDEWLATLSDGDDEESDMPAHLTSGGVAVTVFYLDDQLRAWPMPLERLLAHGGPDAQLLGNAALQPLPDLQV